MSADLARYAATAAALACGWFGLILFALAQERHWAAATRGDHRTDGGAASAPRLGLRLVGFTLLALDATLLLFFEDKALIFGIVRCVILLAVQAVAVVASLQGRQHAARCVAAIAAHLSARPALRQRARDAE